MKAKIRPPIVPKRARPKSNATVLLRLTVALFKGEANQDIPSTTTYLVKDNEVRDIRQDKEYLTSGP